MIVDANVSLTQDEVGLGYVIHNPVREVMSVIANRKFKLVLPRVAELWAILYELQFNLDIGF